MRLCHLRANRCQQMGCTFAKLTKQNQVPEPKMETGKPNHTPRYVLANKVSAPQTTGVVQRGCI